MDCFFIKVAKIHFLVSVLDNNNNNNNNNNNKKVVMNDLLTNNIETLTHITSHFFPRSTNLKK